jgi:hypothetical protein
MVITSSGNGNLQTTGVNVAGYINATGNITGANLVGTLANGNSNIRIAANANVTVSSNGQSNIVTVSSDGTNGLVTIVGNISANNITTSGSSGNITGANVIRGNTLQANTGFIVVSNNGTSLQQVTIQGSTDANFAANYTLTLPVNDGNSGQVLSTDGNGVLSWATAGSGSSISNGNSNVSIAAANGNVTISAVGNANIVVITGTGANIAGNLTLRDTIKFANGTDSNVTLANIQGGVGTNGNGIILNVGTAATDGVQIAGSGRIQATSGSAALVLNNDANVRVSANLEVGYITANSGVKFNANSNSLGLFASTGLVASYNIYLPSNVAQSNGQVLTANTDGTTQWTTISTANSLVNGNSNVVVAANANVTISSAGNANILTITGTGANISGTANVTGDILANANVNVAANINGATFQNGNSSIKIAANANVTVSANGQANVLSIYSTGTTATATFNSNLTVTGNLNVNGNITYINSNVVYI